MKFTLINDLKQDSMMKPILVGLLLFTIAYLIADFFVKDSTIGLFSVEVKETLFGNEEMFLDPISNASFLEFWHMEIFFIMMTLLSLSAVFIRLCENNAFNLVVLNLLLISALITLISFALAFYFSCLFVSIYIIGFFTWHITALYMATFSLWNLLK